MSGQRQSSAVVTVALHALLLVLALGAVFPLAWLVGASFKMPGDPFAGSVFPHGDQLTLRNFQTLFAEGSFGRWMINSLFLAATQTVAAVCLSALGGFALAKYRFAGRRTIVVALLATLLLPPQVLIPSLYEQMVSLRWVNSYAAIVLPGCVSVFGLLLYRQAMRHVPDALLQAARVDGCGELRLWWEIALPAVRPMTGAFTLFCFLSSWNGLLWPQVILQDQAKFTLPVGLANLMSSPAVESGYGPMLAGTLLSLIPPMILFAAVQRDFVSGLMSGGVKE